MRSTLRAVILCATIVVVAIGVIQLVGRLNDRRLHKQSATEACVADARSTIALQLRGDLPAESLAVAVAETRFTHVGGRTTGLAEDDGDRALADSHKTRSDILAVWEFSGYADIPGRLPFGESNRNVFSCNAVVFADHSVVTYGTDVTAWQPGDVIG